MLVQEAGNLGQQVLLRCERGGVGRIQRQRADVTGEDIGTDDCRACGLHDEVVDDAVFLPGPKVGDRGIGNAGDVDAFSFRFVLAAHSPLSP